MPLLTLLLLLAFSGVAYAEKLDVDVEAPDYARAGEIVPIIVEVEHEGSGPGNYVDSVKLYDGNTLLKEWKYGPDNYVKEKEWAVAYKGPFDHSANLRAVAHCTLQGSATDTERIYVLKPDQAGPAQALPADSAYYVTV
jgi:hypothetical protein